MSIEDNENFYILEEDKEQSQEEKTPRNFAAYPDEETADEDEDEEESEEETNPEVSAIGLMFRIMFAPVEGWKKLRRNKVTLESIQAGCFYPLLALLAVSKFADYFYSVNVSLSQIITQGVVAFVSFFFGFYCIDIILQWLLPKDMVEKYSSAFGKNYIVISLSTIALFAILKDLLPMLWPILFFLPIWTMYLMFKGVRFFKFKDYQEVKFYVYAVAGVIGIPLLIDWVLNSVMPY
ncbi:MAG: hypothetical protein J1F43_07300 [Muribaculaceae bacterium]|nr:hypothetical protein [Muribaculaceae bacterium]